MPHHEVAPAVSVNVVRAFRRAASSVFSGFSQTGNPPKNDRGDKWNFLP